MPESSRAPIFVSYTKTKVTSLCDLKRADHVAWKRCGGIYSHHVIVTEVLGKNELEVIHNTVAKEGKAANGGAKCKILRGKVKVDLGKGDLYLCNYEPGECLEPDDVIANAESLLGEKNYNLFKSNCEHFATFCKTLRCFSEQVTSLVDGVRGFCSVAARGMDKGTKSAPKKYSVKGTKSAPKKYSVRKFVASAAKSAVRQKIHAVGEATAFGAIGATRLTKSGMKAIGISGAVALYLAVEGVVFGLKTYNAYKEWKTGDVTKKEFWVKTLDAGWSSGIRVACATLGGLAGEYAGRRIAASIGQTVIPIPIVGGLIGCAIGAVAGHYLGKLGRWCLKKWF